MSTNPWRDLTERELAIAAPRTILLVEDDEHYVERIRKSLIDAHPKTFTLHVTRTMAETETVLEQKTFDLVLLDLGLPDEHGIHTFERAHHLTRPRPIVVISASDDPALAARLLYLGAHDYLIKGASDELLMHVIGRAISRVYPDAGRLPMIEPDPEHQRPLDERDEDLFAGVVGEYLGIVDKATRSRILAVDARAHRTDLRLMAERLGRSNAGSRDALQIHAAAVRRAVQSGMPDLGAWVNESRLVALELMAQLTEYYRVRAGAD